MITPIEIQNKSFKSGGLGYDKRDVDQFMREVLNSYETIYRENVEYKDKITTLTEGLQYYKTIEKTLQKALVLAEKTAESTQDDAKRKAKQIEKEAQVKFDIVISDAKNELKRIQNQTIQLVQQYELYKAQFKSLANAQIELINSESFQINQLSTDTVSEKVSEQNEQPSTNQSRVSNEEFWNQPLQDIDLYLDEEETASSVPETIEGQEEFSFINLEEEE